MKLYGLQITGWILMPQHKLFPTAWCHTHNVTYPIFLMSQTLAILHVKRNVQFHKK